MQVGVLKDGPIIDPPTFDLLDISTFWSERASPEIPEQDLKAVLLWFQGQGVDALAVATALHKAWSNRGRESGAHRCRAKDCGIAVPPGHFMCRRHWFMVPLRLRDTILAAGFSGSDEDETETRALLQAVGAAIEAVAAAEAGRGGQLA